MRKSMILVFVAIVVVVFVIGLSIAASPKQYQYTGAVTEFDAKAKTISVDKGGDIWEFSTDGLKDTKVKKGDRVTVYYTMIAKKIEMK